MTNGGLKTKYWCWTLNNYGTEAEEAIAKLFQDGTATYVIYGREVGEERGTPHLQGYIELRNRKRLGCIKKLFPEGCHFEQRKGTAQEAAEYCKKDGDMVELGEISKSNQGRRNDLEEVRLAIVRGTPEIELANEHFGTWCRYRRSFMAYRNLNVGNSLRDIEVFFLWGAAGTGKTRFAWTYSDDPWISNEADLKWFDGYGGNKVVILDDFRGEPPKSWILRLLDMFPVRVQIKGGYVPWEPTRIWITSNESPESMYDAAPEWMRRITKTFHFSGPLDFGDREAVDRVKAHFGIN